MMLQKNLAEHDKAKAWRERAGLSVAQLAELTGYSPESIYWFERGLTPKGSNRKPTKIAAWVWLRFKRACQGVAAEIRGNKFDW